MQILAFGHKSQTGKNYSANYLAKFLREKGYVVRECAFADKLYEACQIVFGVYGFKSKSYYEDHPTQKAIPLPVINKSPRQILVEFGTNAVREQVYDHVWIDNTLEDNGRRDILLITDLRFPNEAKAVLQRGGKLIKVVNDTAPVFDTVADKALNDWTKWDYVLDNTNHNAHLKLFCNLVESWIK